MPAGVSLKRPHASIVTRSAVRRRTDALVRILTHLMSRRTIASGAAENTPENLRLWIQNPDAIKPGSLMPAMQLSDADLDAVVRYLETLQ